MSQRSPAPLAAHRRALRCLAHPASLAAIVLLLANDHGLKQAHPSALTGKLSDLAGLLFFPFLMAFCLAWLPGLGRDEVRLGRLSIAITALWFAGLQLSPLVEAATMRLVGMITGGDGVNVRDATDLVALAMLWPAWRIWYAEDEIGSTSGARAITWLHRKPPSRLRPLLGSLALVLAAFATLATSPPYEPRVQQLFEVGDRVCTNAVEFENDLYSVACSADGGRSWQPADDVEPPEYSRMQPPVAMACVPPDDRVCYRAAGEERIEVTQDGGRTWNLAWSIPESRQGYRDRILSPPWFFGLSFSSFDPGPDSMIVIGDDSSHHLIVANGSEGVVLRDMNGRWTQHGVGSLQPMPLRVSRAGELHLLPVTLIPETLTAGFFTGLLMTVTLALHWPATARAESRPNEDPDSRPRAPIWIWLLAPIGVMLAFALGHWIYLAFFPLILIELARNGTWVERLVSIVFLLLMSLALLKIILQSASRFGRWRVEMPARYRWLRSGVISGMLGLTTAMGPFVAWAVGWIDRYRDAVTVAIVLSFCMMVYVVVYRRSPNAARDT